jgi:prefoldin subunit 5
MNQINVVLSELDEKIKLLQEKIRNLEESASAVESSKKTKDFDTFAQEFYDKLNQIEEVRSQIFIQSSKMQTKYLEMVKRLDDVEYILEKMKSLERILPLIEKLKIFDEDIKLLRESIEKIKLSMVEQKFYSLIAIIPKVKEKEVLINLLDELDRTIEELKRNDMYRYDKMALSSEVLESQNVKELKLA